MKSAQYALAFAILVGCSGKSNKSVAPPNSADANDGEATRLVYQLAVKNTKATPELKRELVRAVKQRVDPDGSANITVRVDVEDRLVLIISKPTEGIVARIKRIMSQRGTLEFAILANENDHADIIAKARKVEPGGDVRSGESGVIASWREVAMQTNGKPADIGDQENVVGRASKGARGREYLIIWGLPDCRITRDALEKAFPAIDVNGGPAVGIKMNAEGAKRLEKLTHSNLPLAQFRRRLAIILNGRIHSAPSIMSEVGREVEITGLFTTIEVQDIVKALNAKVFPIEVSRTPIQETTVR